MVKIKLTNANNGIIKTVTDTQYNGADQVANIVILYELNEDNIEEYQEKVAEIFSDLSKDLGLHLGSDYDPYKLNMIVDWGDKYIPSIEEIDDRIKMLKADIKDLTALKKSLIEGNEDVDN
jgi:hypothetical protein